MVPLYTRGEGEPSRLRSAALPAATLLLLFAACKMEAKTPSLQYSLSTATGGAAETDEDGDPLLPLKVQAHIQGALEMLCGTPHEPQFMVTEDWYDDGYNPNYPQYPADDMGSGELSDEELDAITASNELRFRKQLEAARAGEYESVRIPAHMIDLQAYYTEIHTDWLAEKAAVEAGEGDAEELEYLEGELAEGAFLGWYPTLRESAEMYRTQCMHCHGTEGGGDGTTAEFLNPRPRDYRHGTFKFTGMNAKARPRREDLYRILEQGVTGTAMPSFRRFSRAEIWGLVDYVRLLSVRGEVERDLTLTYKNDFEGDGVLPISSVLASYEDVWEKWQTAPENYLAYDGEIPEATPELIARGREIYFDAQSGNCQSCHGDYGLGDGPAAYELNEDGSFKLDEDGQRISAYADDWGHPIIPRNITQGLIRGGKRPIDIYRRIYAGINGTPMPGIGESKDASGAPLLSDEDMWALVHFTRSLTERPEPLHHDDAGHGDEHAAGDHGADGDHDEEGH